MRLLTSASTATRGCRASERELARVYEASLMTARHALGRWSGKGWWTGEGARRNVRSATQDPLQPLGQLHRAMASRGLPARSRILCAGVVEGSRKPPLVWLSRRIAVWSKWSGYDNPGSSLSPCGELLPSRGRIRGFGEPCPWIAARFSPRWSASKASHWHTRMKRWTPGRPVRVSRRCRRFTPVRRCCAFARSSTPRKAKPSLYVIGFYRSDRYMLSIRRFRR